MTIEKIVCPKLQINYSGTISRNEVFVKFDSNTDRPIAVMCEKYSNKKETCSVTEKPCIYSEWKEL